MSDGPKIVDFVELSVKTIHGDVVLIYKLMT